MRIETSSADGCGELTVPEAVDRIEFRSVAMIMMMVVIVAKMIWPVAGNSETLPGQGHGHSQGGIPDALLNTGSATDKLITKCSVSQPLPDGSENLAGIVSYVKGIVFIGKSQQAGTKLKKGDSVEPGDFIFTGENGFVNITVNNAPFAMVQPLSMQSFNDLICSDALEARASYTIKMPFITGSVRG